MDKECLPARVRDRATPHPSTPQWFEWKLGKILEGMRERFFSYMFYLDLGKRLKRDTSNAALVEAMCEFEKHLENNNDRLATEFINPCEFLKLVLEKDAPLWGFEEDFFGPLGIKRDRSGLSLPEKNSIATQCAAQVLWHQEGAKIPTIESMVEKLRDRESPFFELLALGRFHNARTIEEWVRPMFPVPPEERKKHLLRNNRLFSDLAPIPGIISKAGTNFLKRHFATECLTRILKIMGWRLDLILGSEFINLLAGPVSYYGRLYLDDWINEAFAMKGNIFPS